MGADVTLISRSRRPEEWELVSPSGTISGIGGVATSLRSKYLITTEGLRDR